MTTQIPSTAVFAERFAVLKKALDDVNPLSAGEVLMLKMSIEKMRTDSRDLWADYIRFMELHSSLVKLEIELVHKVQVAADTVKGDQE